MSILQVSNIWFESTGTKRLGLDGINTITVSTDLDVTGNINAQYIIGNGSLIRNLVANADVSAPFNRSNTTFGVINSAFTQSNLIFGISNSAFGRANAVFNQSNLVFDAANVAFDVANGYGANINFANTVARLAYANANTVGVAFNATNAAFARANVIFLSANNASNTANFENRAVAAFGAVNAAFARSNTIYLIANNASNTANFENRAIAAFAASNIVFNAANAAFAQANIAIANTNYVNTMGVAAFAQANALYANVTSAYNAANSKSNLAVLVANTSVGTGTTYTITSSTITKPYKALELWIRNVSHNNAANQSLQLLLSPDNGTTISGAGTIGGSINATDFWFGFRVLITNTDVTGANQYRSIVSIGGTTWNGWIFTPLRQINASGYINWIRIQPSAGNFDSGAVQLYGYD